MAYRYVVADLVTDATLGELPLSGCEYSLTLSAPGTFRADVRLDELAGTLTTATLRDLTTPRKRALYVYRDGTLLFGGIIWTRRYRREINVVEIAGADWLSYLDRRYNFYDLTIASSVDVYDGMRNIIAGISKVADPVGIVVRTPTATSGVTNALEVESFQAHPVTRMIELLSDEKALFDWQARSVVTPEGDRERQLYVQAPRLGLGRNESSLVFDRSILSMEYPEDGASSANALITVGGGAGEGRLVITVADPTEIEDGYPRIEDYRNHPETRTRDELGIQAQADLKRATSDIILPSAEITADGPPTVDDISLGDWAKWVFADDGLDTVYQGRILKLTFHTDSSETLRVQISRPDGTGDADNYVRPIFPTRPYDPRPGDPGHDMPPWTDDPPWNLDPDPSVGDTPITFPDPDHPAPWPDEDSPWPTPPTDTPPLEATVHTNADSIVLTDLHCVDRDVDGSLWAADSFGSGEQHLWQSTDNGETWTDTGNWIDTSIEATSGGSPQHYTGPFFIDNAGYMHHVYTYRITSSNRELRYRRGTWDGSAWSWTLPAKLVTSMSSNAAIEGIYGTTVGVESRILVVYAYPSNLTTARVGRYINTVPGGSGTPTLGGSGTVAGDSGRYWMQPDVRGALGSKSPATDTLAYNIGVIAVDQAADDIFFAHSRVAGFDSEDWDAIDDLTGAAWGESFVASDGRIFALYLTDSDTEGEVRIARSYMTDVPYTGGGDFSDGVDSWTGPGGADTKGASRDLFTATSSVNAIHVFRLVTSGGSTIFYKATFRQLEGMPTGDPRLVTEELAWDTDWTELHTETGTFTSISSPKHATDNRPWMMAGDGTNVIWIDFNGNHSTVGSYDATTGEIPSYEDMFVPGTLTAGELNVTGSDSASLPGAVFKAQGAELTVPVRAESVTSRELTGLTQANLSGGLSVAVATLSASATLGNLRNVVAVDASSAAVTITLPAVADVPIGRTYTVKKTDSSANAVTIDGDGSETVDDATTQVLRDQYAALTIVSNGSEWWII